MTCNNDNQGYIQLCLNNAMHKSTINIQMSYTAMKREHCITYSTHTRTESNDRKKVFAWIAGGQPF